MDDHGNAGDSRFRCTLGGELTCTRSARMTVVELICRWLLIG